MARGHGRYSIAGEGSLHVIARSTTIKSLRCCLIFILIFAARISILLIATICACIFEYPDDSAINTATNTGREKYSLAGCPMYERCPFRCSQLPSRSVETCGKRLLFSALSSKPLSIVIHTHVFTMSWLEDSHFNYATGEFLNCFFT